jgi:hypothetical protein
MEQDRADVVSLTVVPPGPGDLPPVEVDAGSPRWLRMVDALVGGRREEASWRMGAEGEEKVAARLARLTRRDRRWRSLHALPVGGRSSEIDHVVVGPGGIFTLNAKHHPGARVSVTGEVVTVNGERAPYVRTARHEAERASRLLSAAVGAPVPVVPVIVFVGARDVDVHEEPDGVGVTFRLGLVRWLQSRPETLDADFADAVYGAARQPATWVVPR